MLLNSQLHKLIDYFNYLNSSNKNIDLIVFYIVFIGNYLKHNKKKRRK